MLKLDTFSRSSHALKRVVLALGITMAFAFSAACSDDDKKEDAPVEDKADVAPKDKYAMAAEKEVTAENAEKIADELEKQLNEELKEVEGDDGADGAAAK